MSMKHKRIGRFFILDHFIEKDPVLVKRIMGRCIIMRAEYILLLERIDYQAICDEFDELNKAEMIPQYSIEIFTSIDEEDKITFVRLPDNPQSLTF